MSLPMMWPDMTILLVDAHSTEWLSATPAYTMDHNLVMVWN